MRTEMMMTSARAQRCRERLVNDVAALERYARERCDGRVAVSVARFGDRIRSVTLHFPAVRTPFQDRRSGEVVVQVATVDAVVQFDAAAFPYPLGPPQVRLFYPGKPEHLVPHIGGVHWHEGGTIPALVLRFLQEMQAMEDSDA